MDIRKSLATCSECGRLPEVTYAKAHGGAGACDLIQASCCDRQTSRTPYECVTIRDWNKMQEAAK
jgi:DNA polymerase/3'-5' exonuclease PolX